MTTNEHIDISRDIQDARREAELWAEQDPPYAELMACYAEIGEWLDSDIDGGDLKSTLRFLWRRRDAMNERCAADFEQAWALWCAHNTTDVGTDAA